MTNAEERLKSADLLWEERTANPLASCAAAAYDREAKEGTVAPARRRIPHQRPGLPGPGNGDLSRLDQVALFAEFTPLVHRVIRQYSSDADMRSELLGESYCLFDKLLQAYDPGRNVSLRAYLMCQLPTSIYTLARRHWRRQRREVLVDFTETMQNLIPPHDPTPQWDEHLMRQQVRAALPTAIAQLPARQRKVLIWHYYEDYTFDKIAGLLNIRPATARSLLRHGLNKLRQWAAQDHPGEQ